MAARIKVFCWSDGLHAYTVATTSRAKALAAWGFHRDLFKDGEAREITSGPDYERALASPGVTIRRGLGVSAGQVEALKPETRKRQPARPRKADLERVARLEKQLAAVAEDERARASELEREEEALERKKARTTAGFAAKRRALDEKLKAARARLPSA